MKTLLLTTLIFLGCWACHQSAQTSQTDPTTVSAPTDSAAIADAVHGFYQWYVTFSQDTTHQVDFTDNSGKHLRLVQPKLERYFAHFKASGFVSDTFITGEYAFYKQCSQAWQQELIDEVPSCMDADKYFCAQDWDAVFWTHSPVRITPTGPNKVRATLYGNQYGSSMERNVDLIRENGKWLIAHIDCDMGLNTAATGLQLKSLTIDENYVQSKMTACQPLPTADFVRLAVNKIIPVEKRQAPGAKVCIFDTLQSLDGSRVLLVGSDTGNETEGWLVQYNNQNKLLFWKQVFYADQVEYLKTVQTTVSGNELVISTTTDENDHPSTQTERYVLTDQLFFERKNAK